MRSKHSISVILTVFAFILLAFTVSFAAPVTYTYDDANRLIRAEYENGTAIEYIYDSVGNLISRNLTRPNVTITASVGPNGGITPSGSVQVAIGSSQTFTISSDVGYHIEDVLVDGASVGAVGTYTFSNVTSSHTISATFAINIDTTPDPFAFAPQTGVALNAVITSNTITVSGINTAAPISVAGGEYSINGGAFTSASGNVNNSDTVAVRVTSSGSYSTTTNTTLTIGGVSSAFSVTTKAGTPPSAQFRLSPDSMTSYKVNFNGTDSTCSSPACIYTWNYGDGSSGNGAISSRTYADGTARTVSLTVTDSYLLSDTKSIQVIPTLWNLPPTVSSTSPTITNYTVSFTDTSTDIAGISPTGLLDGAITVDWRDGTTSTGNAGTTFTHTYGGLDVYRIIHTVRNAVGLSASEIINVSVPQKFSVTVTTTPPLSGAYLYLKTSTGSTLQTCTTSSSGSCTFGNLNPATYKVQAYKLGVTFDGDPATTGSQNPVNTTVGPDQAVYFTHTP